MHADSKAVYQTVIQKFMKSVSQSVSQTVMHADSQAVCPGNHSVSHKDSQTVMHADSQSYRQYVRQQVRNADRQLQYM